MKLRLKTEERMKNDPYIEKHRDTWVNCDVYTSTKTGGYISYNSSDTRRKLKPDIYEVFLHNSEKYSFYIEPCAWYLTKEHVEEYL